MLKTHLQLIAELDRYNSPKAKITRMIKANEIIQLKRGIFLESDDDKYSLFSLSSVIYGPSYVSFQSAMSYYGLIPEKVPSVTCASYNKNKAKKFHTPVGDFYYYYIPVRAFPYDNLIQEENGQNYIIASPEKALCDSLYKISEIDTLHQLEELLFEDWRIELADLKNLDYLSLQFLLPLYECSICHLFISWLKRNSDA